MRLTLFSLWLLVITCGVPAQASEAPDCPTGGAVPQRVVVLDWDLLEQLLALQVTPVGAAEVAGYRQWVGQPVAPDALRDVGTRAEPNLETIAALHPDRIVASAAQQDLLPLLRRIAPVCYLPNFRQQDDEAPVALAHLQTLAQLFHREAQAQRLLTALDQQLTRQRARLRAALGNAPPVALIRFSSLTSVFLYTRHSTVHYVLTRLGLTPFGDLPPAPWGLALRRLNALQHHDGYLLYLRPFPQEARLHDAVLWQALPAVRLGRVNAVQPVWNYGGVIALQRLADAITASLLALSPSR